jgi:hypothetical protein
VFLNAGRGVRHEVFLNAGGWGHECCIDVFLLVSCCVVLTQGALFGAVPPKAPGLAAEAWELRQHARDLRGFHGELCVRSWLSYPIVDGLCGCLAGPWGRAGKEERGPRYVPAPPACIRVPASESNHTPVGSHNLTQNRPRFDVKLHIFDSKPGAVLSQLRNSFLSIRNFLSCPPHRRP